VKGKKATLSHPWASIAAPRPYTAARDTIGLVRQLHIHAVSFGQGGRVTLRRNLWLAVAVLLLAFGWSPSIRSTLAGPPTRELLAELWIEPDPGRDLFYGIGGRRLMPDATTLFKIVEVDDGGFSRGYTVVDRGEHEWSAKLPPEAFSEVTASRILWGAGYHQPPIYLLRSWSVDSGPNPQLPARFREKHPDLEGLDAHGAWSYYRNPFVGTRPLAGLLVLQVMLGNSDLKDSNNVLYRLNAPIDGAREWYVARDLGQTFGRTGIINAPRSDIVAFETTPFIVSVAHGRVQFDYRGRHRELVRNITIADVRWICERLNRLTDRQWQDAFRAGGYDPVLADRFIRRMKAKVAEGLALKD
jgi:hypothetical protein